MRASIDFLHFILFFLFFCSLGRVPDVVHPLFIFLLLNFIIIQTQSIRDWEKKGVTQTTFKKTDLYAYIIHIILLFDKNQTLATIYF